MANWSAIPHMTRSGGPRGLGRSTRSATAWSAKARTRPEPGLVWLHDRGPHQGRAALKHVQVREYVRALVAGMAPGSPAPSERELVHQFGVARMTVRQAMDALVVEGLLERIPGKGTFVARPRRTASSITSFTEEMARRGLLPESQTLLARREQAGPGVARALEPHRGRRGHPLEAAAPRRRRARCASRTPTSTRCCCPASCRAGCRPACTTRSSSAACARPGPRTPSPPTSATAEEAEPPRGRCRRPACCGTRVARWSATRSSRSRGASSAPTGSRSGSSSARTAIHPAMLRPAASRRSSLRSRAVAVVAVSRADRRPLAAVSIARRARPLQEVRRRTSRRGRQGGDHVAGLLADPHRVGSAEVGLDVERVLRARAGQAQRPAAGGLEQRVLDVLGDQPRDVHLALGPLLGPPLPGGHGVLEDRDRVRRSPGRGPGGRRARERSRRTTALVSTLPILPRRALVDR